MKNIRNFENFVKESYSILEGKSETEFINKMVSLSSTLLTKVEKKESHFIHNFILAKIYSIYDKNFFSVENISEENYKQALMLLEQEILKFRESGKYKKEEAKFIEKQLKLKKKQEESEEKFRQQEIAAGRTYTPPVDTDDDGEDDDDDDE